MNLKSIFAKSEKRLLMEDSATVEESFLRFSAYAENQSSIYPYWRTFSEEEKFRFVEACFRDISKGKIRNYVIKNKEAFWLYLLDITEFSCIGHKWGRNIYYISSLTAYSFALLSSLDLYYAKGYLWYEQFVLIISSCESAKKYFIYFAEEFERIFPKWSVAHFNFIDERFNTKDLQVIKQSILQGIDMLIQRDIDDPKFYRDFSRTVRMLFTRLYAVCI